MKFMTLVRYSRILFSVTLCILVVCLFSFCKVPYSLVVRNSHKTKVQLFLVFEDENEFQVSTSSADSTTISKFDSLFRTEKEYHNIYFYEIESGEEVRVKDVRRKRYKNDYKAYYIIEGDSTRYFMDFGWNAKTYSKGILRGFFYDTAENSKKLP